MSDNPINDRIEKILTKAGPRSTPSQQGRDAVYASVRATWEDEVRIGFRNRRTFLTSMAASLVAVAAFFTLSHSPQSPVAPGVDAVVARISGTDVRRNGDALTAADLSTGFAAGDRLATGSESRVAVAWQGEGSLRIDAMSDLRFIDGGRIQLFAGRVYYDSQALTADSEASLVVETEFGDVHHVGTQFLTDIRNDKLVIAVREGQVRFAGGAHDFTLPSGSRVSVDADNALVRSELSATAALWGWTTAIAPERIAGDSPTFELIEWIAREAGYSVRYRNHASRNYAIHDTLRGFGSMGPRETLTTIPLATDLDLEVDEDVLIVSLRN